MHDSRETSSRRAFVVGHPVRHSRSPLIHNFWLTVHGLDGRYQAYEVEPAGFFKFVSSLKSGDLPFVGGNVTLPHKEQALHLADLPDETCREIGAANTLWLEEGRLHATNTDAFGFLANLDERHPGWDGAQRAVIFGAGGASRAVIHAVRERGIDEIHVVNRTLERAQELAHRFGSKVHAHPAAALREVMKDAELFVNTTSLGMDGGETPDIDFTPLAQSAVVTDIVYVPLVTPILHQAQQQGFATVDGLGMLLHQAVPGFKKWFGVRPRVDAELRKLVLDDMARH